MLFIFLYVYYETYVSCENLKWILIHKNNKTQPFRTVLLTFKLFNLILSVEPHLKTTLHLVWIIKHIIGSPQDI